MGIKKPSPRVQLIIGILISVGFLYVAVKDIDFAKLVDNLKGAHISWTLPALLILLVGIFLIKAWRWTLILKPIGDYKTAEVLPAVMIGFMGNNIYPAHLGEFLRAYVFAKHEDRAFSTIFSTLVVERILDLIAILAFFYSAIFLIDAQKLPDGMRQGALIMLMLTAIAILGMIPFIIVQNKALALSRRLLAWLPDKVQEGLYGLIEKASEGLQMARSPKLFLLALAASFVHWLLYGLSIIISLHAFDVSITMPQALFLQGITAFAVVIPSSPGFFGVVQMAFVETLSLFDIKKEPVLAASFYYHLSQYIPVTLIGFYYLKLLQVNVDEVRSEKNRSEDTGSSEPESPENQDAAS
jgi:glycosyltransferase 2 family protein